MDVFPGPAIYALADSQFHFYAYPAIVYVGQTDHWRRRHAYHLRKGDIIFDIARAVFIEHDGIRRLLEGRLIKYFKHPESGHADSLLNIRSASRG